MIRRLIKKYVLNQFEFSQAGQDIFALNLIKKNGTYLEIGAYEPKRRSNTFLLEVVNNWKGLSIEYDNSLKQKWDECECRKNPIIFKDAFSVDFQEELKKNNLPLHLNYLSCDIDPSENTYKILKLVIDQGISFDYISYEHDDYVNKTNYAQKVEEYLIPKGYKVAVSNVFPYNKKQNFFETWFIKDSIPFEKIDFIKWKRDNI